MGACEDFRRVGSIPVFGVDAGPILALTYVVLVRRQGGQRVMKRCIGRTRTHETARVIPGAFCGSGRGVSVRPIRFETIR